MKTESLDQNVRNDIAQKLNHILADTYVLYTKTQNFHWNVIDPRFHSLHLFFEKQYEELAEALDEIAERIRMLGVRAPGSLAQFLELTSLQESDGDLNGDDMIRQLLDDHELLMDTIRPLIANSVKLGDEGTGDMLIGRLRAHEKTAWMLRSHLTNSR